MEVDGTVLGPRERIASVAYAIQAGDVADGAITTDKMADGAVTAAKLAPGVGPGGGANLQAGQVQLDIPAGSTIDTNVTITFSPAFSATPIIQAWVDEGTQPHPFEDAMLLTPSQRSSDGFTLRLDGAVPLGSTSFVDVSDEVLAGYSAAVIQGLPAVAYVTALGVYYMRALDAAGETWSAPSLVTSDIQIGVFFFARMSLAEVQGNPAIAYNNMDDDGIRLYYVRSANSDGTAWGLPEPIEPGTNSYTSISLAVIDGVPAIAAIEDGRVFYREAPNQFGTGWTNGPRTDLSITNVVQVELLEVAGEPAVFTGNHYSRRNNGATHSWSDPNSALVNPNPATSFSAALVHGVPAFAYGLTFGDLVYYVQASDPTGATWNAEQQVAPGDQPSLTEVGGHPAVLYAFISTSGSGMRYIRADDADGTSWGAGVKTTESSFYQPQSFLVDGNPAFVHQVSLLELGYRRSLDALGETWTDETAEIAISWIAVGQ